MLENATMFWSFLKLFLALPIVLLLAYISLKLHNQYLSKYSMGKNLQVIEKIPLNNKSFLCIVRIGKEYEVLAVTENNIQVIKTMDEDEIVKEQSVDSMKRLKKGLETNYMKFKRKKGEQ